jgi:Cu/Zn superoxide dismutase
MSKNYVRAGMAGMALAGLVFMASPAAAEKLAFSADLKAASEVPPNNSKGAGTVAAAYDTAGKKLDWTVTYTGLTGAATGAHFHGPADATKNAGVAVAIPGTASPMTGSATLTDAQAADLLAGKWYVNVHTDANKDGEIRGQVVKSK